MKINILWNQPNDFLNGYLNVDVCNKEGPSLNEVADNGEVEEIIAHDIITRYPLEYSSPFIQHWVDKLKYGGKLTLGFKDLFEITKNWVYGRLTEQEVNNLVFGGYSNAYDFRRSSYTMTQMDDLLKSKNVNVLSRKVTDFRPPLMLGAFDCSITMERANAV